MKKHTCSVVMLALSALVGTAAGQATSRPAVPCLLGVDDGGAYHHAVAKRQPWEFEAWFRALDDLGARFVSVHFWPVSDAGERNSEETRRRLEAMDAAMRRHRVAYTLNVELSNWLPRLEITPGVNEFEHPDGSHRWDLRPDCLAAVLPPLRPGPASLAAITYDECEHMVLSNNKFTNSPANTFDKPYLGSTHGLSPLDAYESLVREATRVRVEHYGNRVQPQSEQVWPDLFHVFARAGWIVTPKLLKESLNPVVASIALGAAIQYEEQGARFWASPDLWNRGAYPGHSPEALRSALLMGYWLGAETLYVENVDFHEWTPRHPEADAKGSLVRWSSPEEYELTAHGQVFRSFVRKYLTERPRTNRWQEYDPRVAIIRLPDGGWGQFGAGPGHGESESRNRLLGNREMPLDEIASEWLHVWPILTHGAAKPGAISYNNPFVYPGGAKDFFMPIDSVAVFDHRVTARSLANVACMIVCGHALSPETFQAVRQRVAAGATCVIARRLYAQHARDDLPGDWLIVDRFSDPRIAARLAPFLGPPDVARFRFRTQVVTFRRSGKPDGMDVEVSER